MSTLLPGTLPSLIDVGLMVGVKTKAGDRLPGVVLAVQDGHAMVARPSPFWADAPRVRRPRLDDLVLDLALDANMAHTMRWMAERHGLTTEPGRLALQRIALNAPEPPAPVPSMWVLASVDGSWADVWIRLRSEARSEGRSLSGADHFASTVGLVELGEFRPDARAVALGRGDQLEPRRVLAQAALAMAL